MLYIKRATIKNLVFVFLIFSILGYTYFQTRNLIAGPVITISNPENGSTRSSSRIEIHGSTKNISHITLNNRQIFIDESGAFTEKVLLSPGYNIITLEAEDKFGRKTKEILELVYN